MKLQARKWIGKRQLTKKTTETLSMKAQRPLRKKVKKPTW